MNKQKLNKLNYLYFKLFYDITVTGQSPYYYFEVLGIQFTTKDFETFTPQTQLVAARYPDDIDSAIYCINTYKTNCEIAMEEINSKLAVPEEEKRKQLAEMIEKLV